MKKSNRLILPVCRVGGGSHDRPYLYVCRLAL